MAEKRKTRVGLVLLGGALALAAALILSGALVFAAAWVPIRAPHASAAGATPQPVSIPPAKPGTADTGAEHLVIRESPVVAAEVMGPGRFEYNDQLGDEILARIQALRDSAAKRSLAQTNTALAPFGYRIESRLDPERNKTFYDVYRDGEDEPVLAGLTSVWRLSVNGLSVRTLPRRMMIFWKSSSNTRGCF